MLKKSLIFGSAALFLAALITLTGCPTSVDDDSSGTVYGHRIYGKNVDPYQAQEAIDRAVAAGEPVVLEDGLMIAPAGHLNFKNARVRINGEVVFNGGVVSVVDAAVEWAEDASFTLLAYIHRKGMNVKGLDQSALVEYVDRLDQIMATAQAAAVREYTLGPIADYDYSTSSSGIPARIVAEDLVVLYVLDKLTLPIDGTAPSLVGITALGTADVTGTRPGVSLNAAGANLTLGTCSTLTSSQGGVIVYTPSAATIPNVEVSEGKLLTIQQAAAAAGLDIPGKLKGRGTLAVSTAPDAITIGGGDGNVTFSAPITAADDIDLGNTGVVTFAGALGLGGNEMTIAGDVVFNGNVTTTDDLTLKGNVTLINAGVISFSDVMTLGAGKTISAKITPTPAGSATTIAPVLAAGSDNVVLTPNGAVTLTAEGAPSKNTPEAVSAAQKIIFGGNNLEITTGTLRVAPGAVFEVNDKTLSTKIDPDEIGYLAVSATGALSLAAGTGSTKIDIGDTEISSVTASKLLAEGGTVILGNDKIQGDAVGAKLAAAAGGTNPVFTVDPATAGGKVLILQQVDLNLAAHGSLRIKGLNGTVNQVTLADLAKITLNNGAEGKATDRNKIGVAGAYATLTGDFEAVTAGSATNSQAAWSVAHKGGSNVSLIGIGTAATDVTLAKSGTSFVIQ